MTDPTATPQEEIRVGAPDPEGGAAALMARRREAHPDPYAPDYKTTLTRAPALPLLSLESTPSEETGPRFGHSLIGHWLIVKVYTTIKFSNQLE